MDGLLPLLQEISDDHPESSVQEMATDIRIAIATHGAVWSEKTKSRTKDFSKLAEKVIRVCKHQPFLRMILVMFSRFFYIYKHSKVTQLLIA